VEGQAGGIPPGMPAPKPLTLYSKEAFMPVSINGNIIPQGRIRWYGLDSLGQSLTRGHHEN
jgi:hypothetical protein